MTSIYRSLSNDEAQDHALPTLLSIDKLRHLQKVWQADRAGSGFARESDTGDAGMKIERAWAMPNKRTFQINPIFALIIKERGQNKIWIDPFPFVDNRLEFVDALEFLSTFSDNSVDGVLFDPPYSLRQLKECYNNLGRYITGEESRTIYTKWKDAISRVIKSGGKCISFGWNTNGLGKGRGFEIERILLVAHGGSHNDTLITVERKIQETLE